MIMLTYRQIAELTITYAMYMTFLAGILLLFGEDIALGFQRRRRITSLKERLKRQKKPDRAEDHIKAVIGSVFGAKVTVRQFYAVSGLSATAAFFLTAGTFNPWQCLIICMISAFVPYILCRIALEGLRGGSSHEAEALVSTFLNEYRIKDANVTEAIESAISQGKELKHSKKILFRLLMGLQNAKNHDMRKEAARQFARSIGTNWSRMFSENIASASCYGTEISLSLEDILLQLKDARGLLEERKRLNSESIRIVKLLIPAAYIGTLFLGVRFAGVGWSKLFYNQFATKEGLFLFILIAGAFLANVLIVEIVRNKRFDF